MRQVTRRGIDALNTFTITNGKCDICTYGRRQLVVSYDRGATSTILCNCGSFEGHAAHLHEEHCGYRKLLEVKVYRMLTWVDILKYTILGRAFIEGSTGRVGRVGRVGIQCGCYAKLHRQVAHIANGVQKKMSAKEYAQLTSELHYA